MDHAARPGPPGQWGTSGGSGLDFCFFVCAGFASSYPVAHSDFAAALFPVVAFVCFVALVVSFVAVWIMGSAAGSPYEEDYGCSLGWVLRNVGQN